MVAEGGGRGGGGARAGVGWATIDGGRTWRRLAPGERAGRARPPAAAAAALAALLLALLIQRLLAMN